MKPSRLFRLIAVLGVFFLAMFGVFRVAKEYRLITTAPIVDFAALLVPIVVGTVFFTVGICGIGIEQIKLHTREKSKAVYTILIILVAFLGSLTLYYIFHSWFSALEVAF